LNLKTEFDNRPIKACCELKRDNYKGFKWVYGK
jgi:hypothetical protein